MIAARLSIPLHLLQICVPSAQGKGVLLRLPIVQAINLGLGVPCLAGVAAALAMYCIRVQQARKLGKVW